MSDNNVVTIDQAYIIAFNKYFQEKYDEAINILMQIIKKNNYHIPSLFLYACINIVCDNIKEGLNIFEQMLNLNNGFISEEMTDEIVEITSHFIYYPDINISINYPHIADLHRKQGFEI